MQRRSISTSKMNSSENENENDVSNAIQITSSNAINYYASNASPSLSTMTARRRHKNNKNNNNNETQTKINSSYKNNINNNNTSQTDASTTKYKKPIVATYINRVNDVWPVEPVETDDSIRIQNLNNHSTTSSSSSVGTNHQSSLHSGLDELKLKKSKLQQQILMYQRQQAITRQEHNKLTEKLQRLDDVLKMKNKQMNAYTKTISDTEETLNKMLESIHALLGTTPKNDAAKQEHHQQQQQEVSIDSQYHQKPNNDDSIKSQPKSNSTKQHQHKSQTKKQQHHQQKQQQQQQQHQSNPNTSMSLSKLLELNSAPSANSNQKPEAQSDELIASSDEKSFRNKHNRSRSSSQSRTQLQSPPAALDASDFESYKPSHQHSLPPLQPAPFMRMPSPRNNNNF
jgi:hypothetical protein